jgi:hypothetical protein
MAEEIVQTGSIEEGAGRASWAPRRLSLILLLAGGVLLGAAMAEYLWPAWLVPCGCATVCGLAARRYGRHRLHPLVPAFAAHAGYLLWLLLGAALTHWPPSLCLQLGALLLGVTWLLAFPGLPPVIILLGYDAFAIAGHAHRLVEAPADSHIVPMHLIITVMAAVFLVVGYSRLRRRRAFRAAPRPPAEDEWAEEFIGHELVEEEAEEATPAE